MKLLYMTRAYYRGMFAAGGSFGSSGGARAVSRFAKDIEPGRMTAVATERSQGATFMEGYPRFSFEDEEEGDSSRGGEYGGGGGSGAGGWSKRRQSRRIERPQPQVPMSMDRIKNLLAPADSISKDKPSVATPEYHNKPTAALEQLAPGVEVIHVSFGKGTVEAVHGSSSSASVVVKFDAFEETKKLVFRFAKLVLA
jgi:hypothetical protein